MSWGLCSFPWRSSPRAIGRLISGAVGVDALAVQDPLEAVDFVHRPAEFCEDSLAVGSRLKHILLPGIGCAIKDPGTEEDSAEKAERETRGAENL